MGEFMTATDAFIGGEKAWYSASAYTMSQGQSTVDPAYTWMQGQSTVDPAHIWVQDPSTVDPPIHGTKVRLL